VAEWGGFWLKFFFEKIYPINCTKKISKPKSPPLRHSGTQFFFFFFSKRGRHDDFKRSHIAFQVQLFYDYMTTPAFPAKHGQFLQNV
jgi:hypothetical protein